MHGHIISFKLILGLIVQISFKNMILYFIPIFSMYWFRNVPQLYFWNYDFYYCSQFFMLVGSEMFYICFFWMVNLIIIYLFIKDSYGVMFENHDPINMSIVGILELTESLPSCIIQIIFFCLGKFDGKKFQYFLLSILGTCFVLTNKSNNT